MLLQMNPLFHAASADVTQLVQEGKQDGFARAHGMHFFEYMTQQHEQAREFTALFNSTMSSYTALEVIFVHEHLLISCVSGLHLS